MRRTTCAALLLGLFQFGSNATADSGPLGWGQAQFSQEMETDRPDFTEGTQTVQQGHAQLESGYTYTRDKEDGTRTEQHSAPELLARIGLLKDLELRLAWEGYNSLEVDHSTEDGVTDSSIGFKQRVSRQEGCFPDLSFIGELSLPTGSSEFSSDEVEVAGKILWAYGLDSYGIAGNVNFATPIGEGGRYLEVSSSLALGLDITAQLGAYAEYFGFYPADDVVETTEHYLNGGFTWALSANLQLDIRAGFGLNDAADDFFTGAGVSFRL